MERLGRFEIIAVGAFPLALFFTNIGFDLAAFVRNDFDSLYAPWPFRNKAAPLPEAGERGSRIAVSIGVSALVAFLDALLEEPRRPRAAASPLPTAGPPDGELDSADGAH